MGRASGPKNRHAPAPATLACFRLATPRWPLVCARRLEGTAHVAVELDGLSERLGDLLHGRVGYLRTLLRAEQA